MQIRKVAKDDDFEAIGNRYSCSRRTAYRGMVPQDYLDSLGGSRWSAILQGSPNDADVVMDGNKGAGVSSICVARRKNVNITEYIKHENVNRIIIRRKRVLKSD